jgi:hypothetical protein
MVLDEKYVRIEQYPRIFLIIRLEVDIGWAQCTVNSNFNACGNTGGNLTAKFVFEGYIFSEKIHGQDVDFGSLLFHSSTHLLDLLFVRTNS